MARRRRVFVAGASVHVIQRGNNHGAVFGRRSDYERFIALLREAAVRYDVAVHAFALMTTHVHLLVTPRSRLALPNTMKACGGRYVQYFNRKYSRSGTLWNGRYKPILVEDERGWLRCLRYIERNPVEAGMVRDPGEYPWSSYRTHALGQGNRLPRRVVIGNHHGAAIPRSFSNSSFDAAGSGTDFAAA
jgi:putative transposase